MTDEQAAALVAAGRLLQSKGWATGRKTIDVQAGESYPSAVQRVIGSLPEDERQALRGLVEWVRQYERAIT